MNKKIIYCIKNIDDNPPHENEWINDNKLILRKLTEKENLVLFEKINETVHSYRQYNETEIEKLAQYKENNDFFSTVKKTLKEENFFSLYKDSIIGHGATHGNRVARLAIVIAAIKNLSAADRIILILAGLFHDIGRGWDNINDSQHGEKSFNRLARHMECNKNDYKKISRRINEFILKDDPLNFIEAVDVSLLHQVVSIHSLLPSEKEKYRENFGLKEDKRFTLLSIILDDCDALDRLRFRENLDIRFLENETAKKLIFYADKIQDSFS